MTKKAAVIGHPIKHSLSPLIHNHWIGAYGVDGSYEAIDIAPEDLGERVKALVNDGYAGFNVTLPHKVAVMALCDEVDEIATAIGAVNTVTIQRGKLYGTNTDAFGFMENLYEQCPRWNAQDGSVLVLGAGGAAKAVIYALREAGVGKIILSNRTEDKARDIAEGNPAVEVVPWEARDKAAAKAALIVNTTSLGMAGQDPLLLDLSGFSGVAYDIVYRPLMTVLLQQAAGKGCPVVTGLGMLLHQARPAFAGWFGILPEADDALKEKALRAASAP